MAAWQVGRVSAVFATTDPHYAWVKLQDDEHGWRRIEPRSNDGVSNVFQIATGAWIRDHDLVSYMLNDAGEVIAMANFLI
jgi:urease accessory protein UreE